MSEPENHTLRVLREFRDEFRDFRAHTERNFSEVKERMENIRQAAFGESVLGRYAAGEVEERLSAIEERLSLIEKAR